MKIEDAIAEVKRIAKECDYKGELTESALRECAEVYMEACNEDGLPSPRRFLRSGDKHAPTNLSPIQWLLARTPSFKSWFGKSVVTDANGDPQVMYHGSWKDFKTFKPSTIKLAKSLMTLWTGPGFYFSDKPEIAKIYAGGEKDRVYDVFIRLENPLVVDETGNAEEGGITRKEAEAIFLDGDNTQWLDSGLSAELARMDEADGKKRGGKHFYRSMTRKERVAEFVKRLKTDVVKLKTAAQAYGAKSQKKLLASVCAHTGHDGVIHTLAPEVVEWVVYDPKAIKAASENCGNFDGDKVATVDAAASPRLEVRSKNEDFGSKGETDMLGFKSLIDTLKNLARPEEAMDIVDHLGRHHQPKAIPEGGQYEEEGKYAATATAKEEWFHKTFAENKKPQMKKMRNICAEILAHVDSSKLGNDTAVSDYKQQIHKYAAMPKASVLAGMKTAWNDMKKHAITYNAIKGMDKEQFAGWLQNHPEYNSNQMQALMNNKAYAKTYKIKNAEGEYVDQDHAAWEEAKMMVGRKAVACLVDYMAHTEALHNTPDGIIDSFLKGKGKAEKHKLGFEDYEKTHGIQHGEGENAETATMSEINAVESEMSKAIDDAKTQTEKTAYFHALSHFLGQEGGLRNPNVTKNDVLVKAAKRIVEKENALKAAAASGEKDAYNTALADFNATQDAAKILGKALGKTNGQLGEILFKVKHPDVEGEENDEPVGEPKDAAQTFADKVDSEMGAGAPNGIGENVPTEQITQKTEQIESAPTESATGAAKTTKEAEQKPYQKTSLTGEGKKLYEGIGAFLNSPNGKKYQALAEKTLSPGDVQHISNVCEHNSIEELLHWANQFRDIASSQMKAGDKAKAKFNLGYYVSILNHVHNFLGQHVL